MIPQLVTALSSGYSTKQIMKYLMRQFPQHSDKIKQALAAGFSVDQIIKFLGGGRKSVNEQNQGLTEHEQTRSTDIERRENVNNQALNVGKTAALAGGTALAAPMAMKALQRAAPQLLGPGAVTASPGLSQTQLPPSQGQSMPLGTNLPTQQPPVAGNIAQQPQVMQPQVNAINIGEIINKHGLAKQIEELAKNTQDPKTIAAILYSKFPKEMKKFQAEAGKPMEDAIAEYMQSNVKPLDIEGMNEKGAPINQEAEIQPTGVESESKELDVSQKEDKIALPGESAVGVQKRLKIPYAEAVRLVNERDNLPLEHAGKIEAGQTVATPQGIGEVKAIRNGKALIEIDGKKHQVDEEDLEPTLFTEDEIADAYDDLFSKIPEEHRSGFIQWAGYDEDENKLGFIPRGGKYEELHNITPEEAELIKEGKGIARTTGEEREGLWVMGEDTRGGIISQIIHDRRKGQKEKEGRQLEFALELPKSEKQDKGMKPLFDELGYARNLSKARDKRKRDEERARLKKEKENAKAKKRTK
jgi:hypothetical protein